ncbi:family 78 glycoside hydrolase catalytic domain [Flavobacterium faecale]|uniref:family 78 glycoside hydrolase catalytic domain n=1 Tax=Flavobacterium faecale TaxID=1355330 RepID=UPI003AAF8B1E
MKFIPSKFKNLVHSVIVGLLLLVFTTTGYASVLPVDLKCEYRNNPLGIDNPTPRLSWKIVDNTSIRGQKQTAFHIVVASSLENLNKNRGDLWDSGKITTDQTVNTVYAGKKLRANQKCFWKVCVWDVAGVRSDWSTTAVFSIGLLKSEDWKGEWIFKEGQNKKDHNWYRKNFSLTNVPSAALVYVASFGYHEIYVNGQKVGDGVMNPVMSAMKKRLPYLTYDIQKYLKKGKNVIGLWHAGGWTRWGRMVEYHDAPFVFKAQAAITTANKQLLLVSDASWKCKKSYSSYIGPWDILNFGGEIIDERLREDDWNTAEYNDINWANAVVFDQSTAKETGTTDLFLGLKGEVVVKSTDANPPTSKITATLSSQIVEPQVKFKTVTPIGVKKNANGTYLIDMGENYTGLFEMDLFNGKEGDTLTFEVADQLTTTSSFKQKSQYIYGKTGKGHFTNRFNVAGGRWVTVYGLNYLPELKHIKGHVITNDRKQISKFESSSKLLNTIYQTNLNTYIANTMDGILVDCPHRERRGWGEVTVAAMYGDALPNFESGAYMEQYAQFLQDSQADSGKMRAVINGDDFNFLMWMANSPITMWETYRMLGDKKPLADQYASMVKWMNWLYEHSNSKTGGALIIGEQGSMEFPGLGDWCTPRGNFWSASNSPESAHFNNCAYAFMLDCALNIAKTLDKIEDVKTYTERLKIQRKATHEQSYNPATGKYGEGHQVNQALALLAGITPESEKQKVYANLVDQVLYKFPYYDTGSSGQGLYTRYFTESGERMDLIYELLQDKHHPSYGYFIEQGKTVWPERWSAVGGSQIHTCYTGIGGYFVKGFGGIRPDPENLGMQKMLIKPALVGDLTFANTEYESLYGKVVVNWTKKDNTASFHIEIPVNTMAKIYLPAVAKNNIKEGKFLAENAKGVTYVGTEQSDAVGNYVLFNLESGIYNFLVEELPVVVYPIPKIISENLATIGRMNASTMYIVSDKLPGFEAFKANDENIETSWQANETKNQYLEVEWVKPQTFNKVIIAELGNNITNYKIQYFDNAVWKDVATGTSCGANKEHKFDTITTSKCRILIEDAKKNPTVQEFKIYNSK